MARTSKTAGALLLLAIAFGRATAAPQASIGSSCVLRGGAAGQCHPLKDCGAAKEALLRGVAPVACAIDGSALVVCCPPEPEPGVRATKMCEKYSKAVFVREYLPLLSVEPQTGVLDSCIQRNETLGDGVKGAEPNEFPHMALLGYKRGAALDWGCSGILISERYILTAAHCTGRAPVMVRLGEFNLDETDERDNVQKEFEVARVVQHPDYVPDDRPNDIALIKLAHDVNFTRFYRPACLNTQHVIDTTAISTGWGYTGDSRQIGNILRKKTVNVIRVEVCKEKFEAFKDYSMLCARYQKGDASPCVGDSGGPLQTKHKSLYCMYNAIGVINFALLTEDGCNIPNGPTVFARISHFIPWIESVVWPDWSAEI